MFAIRASMNTYIYSRLLKIQKSKSLFENEIEPGTFPETLSVVFMKQLTKILQP